MHETRHALYDTRPVLHSARLDLHDTRHGLHAARADLHATRLEVPDIFAVFHIYLENVPASPKIMAMTKTAIMIILMICRLSMDLPADFFA